MISGKLIAFIGIFIITTSLVAISSAEGIQAGDPWHDTGISQKTDLSIGVTNHAGDQSYAIGDIISFSGTHSEPGNVFLYLTGPNLPPNGGGLTHPFFQVIDGEPESFTRVDSTDTGSWEYEWDSAHAGLDPGVYMVFVSDTPVGADSRIQRNWDCVSFILQTNKNTLSPSVTGIQDTEDTALHPKPSSSISGVLDGVLIAPGSPITLYGLTTGEEITRVGAWVFGPNLIRYYAIPVETDGSYSFSIPGSDTKEMEFGQYLILLESPGKNGVLDIYPDNTVQVQNILWDSGNGVKDIFSSGFRDIPTQVITYNLILALSSSMTDDIYTKLQFLIDEETINQDITIDPIKEVSSGTKQIVSGTSTLPAGSRLIVRIIPSTFIPEEKTGIVSGAAGYSILQPDEDGRSIWQFPLDTTGFTPDEYHIIVTSPDTREYAVTYFQVD
ncbi:MAG: hypothetical protein JXA44_05640 [Methanospirillaceae archaeon]|nr:hypothetical protein [Methanospirillaceae archaeon]